MVVTVRTCQCGDAGCYLPPAPKPTEGRLHVNRFAALSLLAEAEAGKTVLVLSHTQRAARDAMDDFLQLSDGQPGIEVRRANGAERITFPSEGRLIFRSTQSTGHRGLLPGIVFVDWDCEASATPEQRERLWDHLQPLAATGRTELVRA